MSFDPSHSTEPNSPTDPLVLGKRIRHFRAKAGQTLEKLGETVDIAPSQLSLIENGRREPRLSQLQAIANALGVGIASLLDPGAPDRRSELEIKLEKAQRSDLYANLGLPTVRGGKTLPDEALEALVGLHGELERRERQAIATPEEARRANKELRSWMREQNNYLPDIEELAEEAVAASGHVAGALTHREVGVMAENLGFKLLYVNDLPHSARSVTDYANKRIYIPPASIPGGHGLRSMALQAIAHRLLGHSRPTSYAKFLKQRLEINYFAACALIPRSAAVEFLQEAKTERDLAIEDFRDAFGVTHEAAALRFTNLATSQLDMECHFLRVGDNGALYKGYENDGLPLPSDVTGAIEGQPVCRHWAARAAFAHPNRTTELYQYTDTPTGTFWCATQTGATEADEFTITIGVPFSSAKWFRGRETTLRATSRCPDGNCCRKPPKALAERWENAAWPSARLHAQILASLPSGNFPGVDETELYDFLERHAIE